MNFGNVLVMAAIGLALVFAGYWVANRFFSEEARLDRRRRRSNARIASKTKRPMVKFSVRTPRKD